MGKAFTFLYQFARFGLNGLETVAAPVTMFSEESLIELRITDIPNEVSSLTTDGKGNSVRFTSTSNKVIPGEDPNIRLDFVAQVDIVGGTGKFAGAKGNGEVTGFINPSDGKGSSVIRGRIEY